MFQRILVPTDGSARSMKAAAFALKLARSHHATIVAQHVIPTFKPTTYADAVTPFAELYSSDEYRRATQAYAKRMLDRVAKRAKAARVRCETTQCFSDAPWRAIIAEARKRQCDVIVMASRGRSSLKGLLLGSETTKVLANSKTPVLVTR